MLLVEIFVIAQRVLDKPIGQPAIGIAADAALIACISAIGAEVEETGSVVALVIGLGIQGNRAFILEVGSDVVLVLLTIPVY